MMRSENRKKIRNPLRIRILREFRAEWKKYTVIFVFLTLMTGFISGMYVANNSMLIAADSVKTDEIREDGHFILREKADKDLKKDIESGDKADVRAYYVWDSYKDITTDDIKDAFGSDDYRGSLEKLYRDADERAAENYENAAGDYDLDDPYFYAVPVTIYENFRKNADEDFDGDGERDSGIRVYINRDDIDLYCLMDGKDAVADDEIVIDRMHADNRGIKTGDIINVNGTEFKVSGLAAFSNYSTLHEKSTDMMFDALTFDVAMTTKEGWDRIESEPEYEYAWLYDKKPVNVKEEKKMSDNFLKALITQAAFNDNEIEDYVPEYANRAIQFAPEDFGSDKTMGGVILDILIVVLAFIFAVTISNTIAREAAVIGTLRASGYSRSELTVHYMASPVMVTLLGALAGNVLGYTYFKNTVVAMYYNSYSLPRYETVWTQDAFIKTTVIPVALMFAVNLIIISRKLRFSPLRFLRNDLGSARGKRAFRLPPLPFIHRFRLRIFLQNISGYFVLAIGIGFVMLMLAMAVGMPDTLSWYQKHAGEMMLSEYQLMLTADSDEDGDPIETDAAGAEKFSIAELIAESGTSAQSVNTYGVEKDSNYAKLPSGLAKGEVFVSSAYSGKYGTAAGDTIELSEKYGYKTYKFKVAGVLEYDGGVAVFMDIDNFNSIFDRDEGSYNGFFSDIEIKDIDDDYVAAVISSEDIIKMTAQLDHSMGAYMLYFQYLCIMLSAVLIFLLTKVILERSEKSISMVKILGYSNREIASLYIVTTTAVVILSEIVTAYAAKKAMVVIWNGMMSRMEGYFPFIITRAGMLRMLALVFAGYMVVMLIDFSRIKRISMDEALKNIE